MSELFKNLPDPNAPVVKTDAEKLVEAAKPVIAAQVATVPAPTPAPQVANPAVATTTVTATPPVVDDEDEAPQMDELTMLKSRAQLMGITHSNNIGIDALKAKIKAKLEGEKDTTDADGNQLQNEPVQQVNTPSINKDINTATTEEAPVKQISLRQHMQETQMKLVRLRITNLDPKKKDIPGEIITVANEYLGTVKKYVPFGAVTDGGYHVPQCIYEVLKERTFVSIKTRKGPRNQQIIEHSDAREFSLEVLPPLTASELAQLATAQQAKGGLDTE